MDSAIVDNASEQYVGQWRRLVSTTNWEKGRIIHQWREELRASDAPSFEYSDDAWSRRVGNVTPQHVGRLRRVFDRFETVREAFPGLFWSHFQAALDWDDAEMWLEGAVRSDWSVEDMRRERSGVLGELAGDEPAEPSLAEPWDEDAEPSTDTITGTMDDVRSPEDQGADAEDADEPDHSPYDDADDSPEAARTATAAEVLRPFAALPPLPADVNDAFEAYKLCILRHKLSGWLEISRDDLLDSLAALRQLALAPADAP